MLSFYSKSAYKMAFKKIIIFFIYPHFSSILIFHSLRCDTHHGYTQQCRRFFFWTYQDNVTGKIHAKSMSHPGEFWCGPAGQTNQLLYWNTVLLFLLIFKIKWICLDIGVQMNCLPKVETEYIFLQNTFFHPLCLVLFYCEMAKEHVSK